MQRAVIVAPNAHLRLDASARLNVVIENMRLGIEHRHKRRLLRPEKVWHQYLDMQLRVAATQSTDRLRPMRRTLVGQIIAVNTRHDYMAEPHPFGRRRDLGGLQRIECLPGFAARDGAITTGARAGVTHDLERRSAAPPTLADVRTASLLTHRVQTIVAHDSLQFVKVRTGTRRAHTHPIGSHLRLCAPGHLYASRSS